MKPNRIICSIILGIATVIALVELIHPAPKITDYCQQPSCYHSAVDLLTVKNDDYRGNLVPALFTLFGLSVVGCIIAFVVKGTKQIVLVSLILFIATLIEIVQLRFLSMFTWWPAQTWIVLLVLVFSIASVLLKTKLSEKKA